MIPTAMKVTLSASRCHPTDRAGCRSETPYHFVSLEQVMIHNLDILFRGMEIIAAHSFRVTRNADVKRDEEENRRFAGDDQ